MSQGPTDLILVWGSDEDDGERSIVKKEDLGKKNEGGNEDYLRPIFRDTTPPPNNTSNDDRKYIVSPKSEDRNYSGEASAKLQK